ncbi:MAG: hypothetical protein KF787_10620 [Phycisphaeraceae bacterium]|nr:hypothetical protein [Phycisphaerae bacterium]MBX3393088.1 hypothetical protein [Phycisphaeraceae bacterium]
MSILRPISGLSPAGKTAVGAGGAGAIFTTAGFLTGLWIYMAYIAAALAAAVALVVAFRLFLKWRQKGRSSPFVGRLLGATSGSPATADPALRARIDDLRKRFEEGIEKFKAAGKDVYSLPWVLMAGPSGSGKTEAVRHCNVGFPPGLQDPLQGTGGTLNMNWWFTNHAVVLDTAGKLFMEEGGGEWKELMKLLKAWRPLQPVNGMILAIGVDSLIKDSAEKIESEASKVARQLDAITRDLDVRFPVYVWVTKCDLLIGFREFFSTVTDPQLQHQMLGWSNPADLDEKFQADKVTEHLEQVCKRLARRRGGLLSDPTPQNMQSVNPRRIDETDALYALPESLASIGSRLRRYLELIFVQGEWSAKPLFLRGIYFTSALQEGAELDEAIARAMGVPVDALPGGSQFTNTKKSYFLRDVLMAKIFPEKGLVTRATSVKQQQRGRRLALLGSGIGVVALCIAATIWGYFTLAGKVDRPASTWKQVHEEIAQGDRFVLFRPSAGASVEVNTSESSSALWKSPAQLLALTAEQTTPEREIRPPVIFKGLAGLLSSDLNLRVGQAHAAVTDLSVVRPLVKAARSRFVTGQEIDWAADDDAAVKTFASLMQIERSIPSGKAEGRVVFPVGAYLRLLGTDPAEIQKIGGDVEMRRIEDAVDRAAASTGQWPPQGMRGLSDPKAIEMAAASFNRHWASRLRATPGVGPLVELQDAITRFDVADKELAALAGRHAAAPPVSRAQYDEFKDRWIKGHAELTAAWENARKILAAVSIKDADATIAKAGQTVARSVNQSYRLVLGVSGSDGALDKVSAAAADKAKVSDPKVDAASLGDMATRAADEIRIAASPDSIRPAVKSLFESWRSLSPKEDTPGGEIAAALDRLRDFYGKGLGSEMLTAVSGDSAIRHTFEARFEVYRQATEIFTAAAFTVAWGAVSSGRETSLRDATDAIESDLASRMAVIDQRSRLVTKSAANDPEALRSTGQVAARIAAMGRRTQALQGALAARGQADLAFVRSRVEQVARDLLQSPGSDPSPARLRIPTPISPREVELAPAFDPEAARRVMNDGAEIIRLSGQGAREAGGQSSDPLVIEPALLAGDARSAADAVRAYATLYFNDWAGKPATVMASVSERTWPEYRRAVEQAVAANLAGSDLSAMGAVLLRAFQAIPPVFDADLTTNRDAGRDKWIEALRAEADRPPLDTTIQSARNWGRLDDDPRRAFATLAPMSAADLLMDYFANFSGGDSRRLPTPSVAYWDFIRLEALSILTQEVRRGFEGLFDSLADNRKFPLAMEPPAPWNGNAATVAGMTIEKVREFHRGLDALAGSTASRPAATAKRISAGDRTRVEPIDRLLDRLFGANKMMDDPRASRLVESWQRWIPLVAGESEPLRAAIIVVSSPERALSAEAEGFTSAGGLTTWFRLTRDGAEPVVRNNTDVNSTFGDAFPVHGSASVKFEFADVDPRAGGGPRLGGTRDLVSGWSVLELLADPDVRPMPGDTEGKRWMVPVRFNGTNGGTPAKYYMWMGIELNKSIGKQDTWPGTSMWRG